MGGNGGSTTSTRAGVAQADAGRHTSWATCYILYKTESSVQNQQHRDRCSMIVAGVEEWIRLEHAPPNLYWRVLVKRSPQVQKNSQHLPGIPKAKRARQPFASFQRPRPPPKKKKGVAPRVPSTAHRSHPEDTPKPPRSPETPAPKAFSAAPLPRWRAPWAPWPSAAPWPPPAFRAARRCRAPGSARTPGSGPHESTRNETRKIDAGLTPRRSGEQNPKNRFAKPKKDCSIVRLSSFWGGDKPRRHFQHAWPLGGGSCKSTFVP